MSRDLFASFAVVALFVAIWALSQEWIRTWPRRWRMLGAGLYMGLAAVVSMMMAVHFTVGVLFDLRSVVLGLAGLFGGPVAAVISGVIAAAYRIWLGGPGLTAGLVTIAAGCLSGWIAFALRKQFGSWPAALTVFSVLQASVPLSAMLFLPAEIRALAFYGVFLPLMAWSFLAALLSGNGIELSRRRGWLANMLKDAIRQAPDSFYIKDRNSRFVLANSGAVRALGARDIDDALGKTDFDFDAPDHAAVLFDAEQEVMRTGEPIVDLEETIRSHDGTVRTYVTTKSAIRNADGSVAGLVGFTKDFTERVALERRLQEQQDDLDVVLSGMSDGIARFDQDNRLMFQNANYAGLFPKTGAARRPGAALADILDAVLASGEQIVDPEMRAEWKARVLANTVTGGEEQVQMADGRWLRIRTQPLMGGGAVVIVSDVSAFKRAEFEQTAAARQFRLLATTDGLTGLHNRRDFDEALAREFSGGRAGHGIISLLMIDIDHFKKFNDFYGHLAGDECLRRVAECIGQACKREGDVAARYGGEEFAVILPGTDPTGAAVVAGNLLKAIAGMQIPHEASASGVVSVSIGIASGDVIHSGATELLKAADAALYQAKSDGRDRFVATRL
ncbi:PAS domain S-box-containing protein/diguanylate cyclase (GGDEF) domain-containing protein [Devosia lucknowensis]|uniref:diguanylate cyclase n=1 Tax=Devosia lucknowensis TaxID=1096929 RepID=A0A1Y6E7M0_9HYPH|nr:diguanylate cyclase [Devosia lucknowensis]SMQ58647.1 PAS domain S-box-containing protein/diguanylate cyclase (GGDEF) domain-containing protein [Devosia lucknowensis]